MPGIKQIYVVTIVDSLSVCYTKATTVISANTEYNYAFKIKRPMILGNRTYQGRN